MQQKKQKIGFCNKRNKDWILQQKKQRLDFAVCLCNPVYNTFLSSDLFILYTMQ